MHVTFTNSALPNFIPGDVQNPYTGNRLCCKRKYEFKDSRGVMAVVILMSTAGAFVLLVKHTDNKPALRVLCSDLATWKSRKRKKKQNTDVSLLSSTRGELHGRKEF